MRLRDPDQQIEELFNHCNRCRSFAREGKDPISDESMPASKAMEMRFYWIVGLQYTQNQVPFQAEVQKH
jgi:hypothetical protein